MKDSQPSNGERECSRATFDLVTDWLQIITSAVVIAGLGLVIWELKQARELTQAQLTSEGWARLSERNMAIVGENGAEVLAKACDQPDALTRTDVEIMQVITHDRLTAINRIHALNLDAGLYTGAGMDWTRFSEQTFRDIFATEFGRVWWRATRQRWAPEVTELGDRYLDQAGRLTCGDLARELSSTSRSSREPQTP